MTEHTDPHHLDVDTHRAFWADEVADAVEARDPTDPIVVKGGVSPSGVPHIGHFNEIMRGYYVAESLRERGHEVRQVFTTDDRDPLRKVPRKLATLDWEVVDLGDDRVDASVLGRNLGQPYTSIPDPFGCCDSYGDHFTTLLARSAELVDVPIEVVSNTDLYEEGAFEDVTRFLLEHRAEAREVLAEYQDSVDGTYVPFTPQCAECGNLTGRVTDVDLDADEVQYVCEDVEAGGQTIQGCGHEGVATLREGKLPWRFEWPAQWQILGVDFEPFGKDHAEGSWPSGEHVAREVLDIEPPVPMVYEWFTLEGEALSSSAGNVVTVAEVLDLLEVEVFRYFFTKNPKKQRDFSVAKLDRLVDEFDRAEATYFEETDAEEEPRERAGRAYPMARFDPGGLAESVAAGDAPGAAEADLDAPDDPYALRERYLEEVYRDRERVPYRFAAVLGMTDDDALREAMARRSGHIAEDAPAWAVSEALDRVEQARTWAVRTDNEYNYRLAEELPAAEVTENEAAALEDLADAIENGTEDVQGAVYESARGHDVDVGEFFTLGYRLFLDEEQGPRLGPFLDALDTGFVVRRLRREG
jgi:lysyl-tRNA synthetase class 1